MIFIPSTIKVVVPRINLTSKNATVAIVLFMDAVFFMTAIGLAVLQPALADLSGKVWALFLATNAALFLALNASGNNNNNTPDHPAVAGE
jgi:hypothetical protein